MYRYVSFVFDPTNAEQHKHASILADQLRSLSPNWKEQYNADGFLVMTLDPHHASNTYRIGEGSGVVIGNLFIGSEPVPVPGPHGTKSLRHSNEIVATIGRSLMRDYWGRYVAFLIDDSGDRRFVLRDPSGALPCFHFKHMDVLIFCSFIEDCVSFPELNFEPNVRFARAALLNITLHNRDTGLLGVAEVLPGDRVEVVENTIATDVLWNPVEVIGRGQIENTVEASEALRCAVRQAVNGWARSHRSILHQLSGGLDSSIVAGCLGEMADRPNVTCLNFFTRIGPDDEDYRMRDMDDRSWAAVKRYSGHADERHFARQTAEKWGFPLVEEERTVAGIDLKALGEAPPTIRPSGLAYDVDVDRAQIRCGLEVGAQSMWSGHGGDGVFFASPLSLSAAEFAYVHGFSRGFGRRVLDAAMLSGDSVWSVLGVAIKQGILRRPRPTYSYLRDSHNLLSREAQADLDDEYLSYPWPEPLRTIPPSKRLQVESYGNCLNPRLFYPVARHFDLVDPLYSQPVMETCLRIPTYVLVDGGVSRGLARRTFADVLVPDVRKRQVKGAGDPFLQRLVRENIPFFRESLIGGELARQNALDTKQLDAYLHEDQPFLDVPASQLVNYLAVEFWLRSWRNTRQLQAA